MSLPNYVLERPWSKLYPEGLKPDLEIPDEPYYAALDRVINKYGDRTALIFLGDRMTYKTLGSYIEKFRRGLYSLGVKQGDKVGLYLLNTPQFVIAYFAVLKLGATVVPMNPTYTPSEVEYILNDSGAEMVICHDINLGNVTDVAKNTNVKDIIVTYLDDYLSPIKRLIGRGAGRIPKGKVIWRENILKFKKVLGMGSRKPPEPDIDVDNDIASLPYTGGTLGLPKGVVLTHKNLVACRHQFLSFVKPYWGDETHVVTGLLPFYHIYGQVVIMGGGLSRGDTIVIFPRLNMDALLKAIEKYRITIFYGIPALYNMILNHDRLDLYDLSSVQYYVSGADVLPIEVEKQWKERFGRDIIQGYGLTESAAVVAINPFHRYKVDAIGIPIPNTYIAIREIGGEKFLDIGETGELVVSAPQITRGYWNKPAENKEAFFEAHGKRWFRTGDVVWLDEEGYIHFVDRAKDIIKYKGYLVAAAEVEAVLYDHPAVKETCVIGVPDPAVGERVKAFVVLHDDARGVTAQSLLKWCRSKLAPYKVPQMIEIRDMLPKSTVGKILRRELREEELKRMARKVVR